MRPKLHRKTRSRSHRRAGILSFAEPLESRWALAVFVVNTTDDRSDATSAGDGIVDIDLEVDGLQISLRGAIEESNALSGADSIEFAIPSNDQGFIDIDGSLTINGSDTLADQFVIQVRTELPELDDSEGGTTIDGSTQTTFGGDTNPNGPEIAITQLGETSFLTGLVLASSDNQVVGLNLRGFNGDGIQVRGQRNELFSNYIGTDGTGTQADGNTAGATIFGDNNQVGSAISGQGNLIAGNRDAGLILFGSDNQVEGNRIGVSSIGTALGNQEDGIQISNQANGNRIGSPDSAGNVIAFNGRNGVTVAVNEEGAINNSIRGNSIFRNGSLGIDLSESTFATDGVTLNDPADADNGANRRQNFPVINSAIVSRQLTVQGTLQSLAQQTYLLDFYLSDEANPGSDGSPGFGEGQQFLGSTVIQTDGNGTAPFVFTVNCECSAESVITATATDPDGNTSEFSQAAVIELDITRRISGTILEDLRGDGRSNDDRPFAGIEVGLFKDNGNGQFDGGVLDERIAVMNPDADGRYSQDEIPPGQYFVTPTDLNGLQITFGPNDATFYSVVLDSEDVQSLDFGIFQTVQIAGRAIRDTTGNGESADDTANIGFTIALIEDNGNGELDAADEILETTTSIGPDGAYQFRDVGSGRYFVVPRPAENEQMTFGGSRDAFIFEINTTSGTDRESVDFGAALLARVSGRVWIDQDQDGQFDDGEPGQANWVVELLHENGAQLTQLTDQDGNYTFVNVPPGAYSVTQQQSDGFEPTFPTRRFASGQFLATGTLAGMAHAADMNGDSLPDVLVLNDMTAASGDGTVWYFQNQGNGSFREAVVTSLGSFTRPRSLVPADVDQDGDLDVVVTTIGRPEIGSHGTIYWLQNQGDGTWTNGVQVLAEIGAIDLALGDVNRDGRLDLAAIDFRTDQWYLWLQDSSGNWNAAATQITGRTPRSIAMADINQDAILDLLIGSYDDNGLSVLEGLGDGRFELSETLDVAGITDLLATDLDDDGRPELLTSGRNGIELYARSSATSSFVRTSPAPLIRGPAFSATVGDLNGDGVLDVIGAQAALGQVAIAYGSEGLTFGTPLLTPMTIPESISRIVPHSVGIADFDGDQRADLLTGFYVGGASVQYQRVGEYRVELEFGDEAGPLEFANFPVGNVGTSLVAIGPTDAIQAAPATVVANGLDANGDGKVSPMDALLVINRLTTDGPFLPHLDINQDGLLSPVDALIIINHLNGAPSSSVTLAATPDLTLLASALADTHRRNVRAG